jgi:multicomponent Na+:H+ antiporter subunit D
VEVPATKSGSYQKMMIPAVLLVVLSIAYGIGSEWLVPYMTDAADVLLNPSIYIDAVLKE